MHIASLLQGFRLIDSFFPSGGFAFSSGLEAAVQGRHVQTADDLNHYVCDYLRCGIGKCEAVAVAQAHYASAKKDLLAIETTDTTLESMKLCKDTRLASRQMGQSVLNNSVQLDARQGTLNSYKVDVDSGTTPGHLAVVLGVMFEHMGWNQEEAIAGFLYQTGVSLVSASYKLLPIGQREGQRLLEQWTPVMEELSQTINAHTPMMTWAPLQEICAMRHSQLTTRMFRS